MFEVEASRKPGVKNLVERTLEFPRQFIGAAGIERPFFQSVISSTWHCVLTKPLTKTLSTGPWRS